MVYIWERESAGSETDNSSRNPVAEHTRTQSSSASAAAAAAVSPAYYPPRNGNTRPHHPYSANTHGTNVKPLKVLEGHGDGAVFDVRWCSANEGLISAGEDGAVGLWEVDEDEEEGEVAGSEMIRREAAESTPE